MCNYLLVLGRVSISCTCSSSGGNITMCIQVQLYVAWCPEIQSHEYRGYRRTNKKNNAVYSCRQNAIQRPKLIDLGEWQLLLQGYHGYHMYMVTSECQNCYWYDLTQVRIYLNSLLTRLDLKIHQLQNPVLKIIYGTAFILHVGTMH